MAISSTNPILIGGVPSAQSVYEYATTPKHLVGTRGRLDDGREFEYVRSKNSTAIGKGKLATYDPVVAAIDNIAVQAAVGVGDTMIPVTVTATLTVNELVGGYFSVEDVAGHPELYRITASIGSGTAGAHSSGTLQLYIDRPVVVAMTTSTTGTIIPAGTAVKISAGVTANAEAVEVAAGVPLVNIPASDTTNSYFWVQKTGHATVLFGTVVGAVGGEVYHGEDAGSFQQSVDTTAQAHQVGLGTIVALLPIDTKYAVVNLGIR